MTRLVAVIACLMAIVGSVVGADETLTLDLSVGIGGKYVTRHWNIASVTVSNPGPPISGRLQIELREMEFAGGGDGKPASTYSMPVSLPHGDSTLDLAVLVPYIPDSAVLRLSTDRGVIFEDTKAFDRLGDEVRRPSLVITRRHDIASIKDAPGDVLFFPPNEAPTDARAYDGMARIVLDDARLEEIPAQARRSILQWTATGGLLLLSGQFLAHNRASPELPHFTYVKIKGMSAFARDLDVAEIFAPGQNVSAVVTGICACRARTADILSGPPEAPIVFEHTLSGGTVRGVTVDPEWMEFDTVRHEISFGRHFWAKLLEGGRAQAFSGPGTDIPISMLPDEAKISSLRGPLLVYVAIFVLVMGPINFFVLARLRRREWMAFTAPLAVAVFVVAAIVMAYVLHDSQPLLTTQSINVISAGSPTTGSYVIHGVFAPKTGRYDIQLGEADAPVRELLQDRMDRYYRSKLPPVEFAAATTIKSVRIKRWAMRVFHDPAVFMAGTVDGKLQVDEKGFSGWVENRLPVNLNDCVLLHKWNGTEIGDLAAGKKKQVTLPLGAPALSDYKLCKVGRLKSLNDYLHWELWKAGEDRQRWYLGKTAATEVLSGCADPLLIGWGPALVAGPQVSAPGLRTDEQHLYVVRLPVAPQRPSVSVPVGASLAVDGTSWSWWYRSEPLEDDSTYDYDYRQEAVTEFLLPIEGVAVAHGELTVQGRLTDEPGAGYVPILHLDLYNWETGDWETISRRLQERFALPLPDARRFILMPRGLVRVKLGTETEEDTYRARYCLLWMDLSYQGDAEHR